MPILHHYEISPFSEKVRLAFGLKCLAWRSVIVPDTLPKPDYLALTGGYRRTPSLQIGADIYCDTRLIVAELERRWPTPTLFPGGAIGVHRALESWAETSLFWPCALAVTGANVDALPPAFHADRAAMRGRPPPEASRVRAAGERAWPDCVAQVAWIENMLSGSQDFLLGAAPGLADLAVYHALWFLDRLPQRLFEALAPSPALRAWCARVAAIGHGRRTEMPAAEALQCARSATPAALAHDPATPYAVGTPVAIEPDERTSSAVTGVVAACTREWIAIDREDPRAGHVRVHFPRLGYRVLL